MSQLHTTSYGTDGPRVVFLHGLFGQGRNWTTPARAIAGDGGGHRVTLVDMPNHGRSEWADRVDYVDMADTVGELLATFDEPVDLVGHSMGGKAAMMVALRHPELVARLMVVDSSPIAYSTARDFITYVAALRGVDLATIHERGDADAVLAPLVPSQTIRSFLLQNLRRDGDSWRWQPNLEVIGRDLDALAGWPAEEAAARAPYDGPVLWVAGETSDYIKPEYADAMRSLFPRYRKVTVKGAGHWVHSEQPEIFLEVLKGFVRS